MKHKTNPSLQCGKTSEEEMFPSLQVKRKEEDLVDNCAWRPQTLGGCPREHMTTVRL